MSWHVESPFVWTPFYSVSKWAIYARKRRYQELNYSEIHSAVSYVTFSWKIFVAKLIESYHKIYGRDIVFIATLLWILDSLYQKSFIKSPFISIDYRREVFIPTCIWIERMHCQVHRNNKGCHKIRSNILSRTTSTIAGHSSWQITTWNIH